MQRPDLPKLIGYLPVYTVFKHALSSSTDQSVWRRSILFGKILSYSQWKTLNIFLSVLIGQFSSTKFDTVLISFNINTFRGQVRQGKDTFLTCAIHGWVHARCLLLQLIQLKWDRLLASNEFLVPNICPGIHGLAFVAHVFHHPPELSLLSSAASRSGSRHGIITIQFAN